MLVVKKCGCGREHTQADWEALPLLCQWVEECIEMRNCPCGSTIALPLPGYEELNAE